MPTAFCWAKKVPLRGTLEVLDIASIDAMSLELLFALAFYRTARNTFNIELLHQYEQRRNRY